MGPAQRLRERLTRPGLIQAPGCFDAFSARLVEQAGFEVAYATGFGAAASRYGLPDTGLVSFGEMAAHVTDLAAAVGIPVIADADTGYGNVANVHRTVRTWARAGVAAVQIEDQVWPKRCGHTKGTRVLPLDEALLRLRAAIDAGAEHDVLIVARTDARAVHGYDDAHARCRAFAAEGADIVFPEALESREELEEMVEAVDAPILANLIEGGKTPLLEAQELEAIGVRVAIHPLTLLLAAASAMQAHLAQRPLVPWPGAPTFDKLRELVGFPEYDALLERYGR